MTNERIAVLGYGTNCSDLNKDRAFQAGRQIALSGFEVCAGNLMGTFYHAFKGAKSASGRTLAILEFTEKETEKPLCDEIVYTSDSATKHKTIAEKCFGAIVIGGGEGTMKLIIRLLEKNRYVIAINNSGGVVNSELDKRVKVVANIEKAIEYFLKQIS